MIPGRGFSLKALIAGSLFLNGLAIGICALYLLASADSKQTVSTEQDKSSEKKELLSNAETSVNVERNVEDENPLDVTQPAELPATNQAAAPIKNVSSSGGERPRDQLPRMLENADSIGVGGDFNRALKVYEAISSLDQEYRQHEIAARIALCRESIGQSKQAHDSYQAIAEQSDDARLVAACRIGVARTTLRQGKPELASRLLWKMLLNGDLFQQQDALTAELIFLLAESELIQFERLAAAPPASPQRIASASISGASVDFFRLLIGIDHNPDGSASNSFQLDQSVEVVNFQSSVLFDAATRTHNPSLGTELVPSSTLTIEVDVNPHLKTAEIFAVGATKLELVSRIAEGAGLSMQIDEAARNRLMTEFQDVNKSQIKIDMALDALLLSSGMLWTTHEQKLKIVPAGDNPQLVRSSRLAGLERILRHGIIYFPGHRQVLLAKTALANVTLWQGNPAIAIGHYENLLREPNLKRFLPLIRFNLAVSYLQLNELAQAEYHFQQVIDNSLSGAVLGEAYLHNGILQIESERPSDAVRSFSGAMATARETDTKRAACLGLAAAYLENTNPYAALTTIESNKKLFNESLVDSATFLVCLARYRVIKQDISQPARYLLSAASRVQPQDLPGMIGFKLVADAFNTLNLQEEKLATLELAARQSGASNLRYSLELARARAYSDSGQLEAAAEILDLIGSIPSSTEALNNDDVIQAIIELVKIRFRMEQYDAALSACRHAIQLDTELSHKEVLLEQLGRIFQKQGNNVAAAMCFAGLMPTWEEE